MPRLACLTAPLIGVSLLGCLCLLGCKDDPQDSGAIETRLRPASDRLTRASMALRGVRPTTDELRSVQADPSALDGLIDGWLTSEAFADTIRDMHAEQLRIRSDLDEIPPPVGALDGYTFADTFEAMNEAPLRLISDVVISGRPYTDIVRTDELWTNAVGAAMWGYDHDPSGEAWQQVSIGDDRPVAGVLSDGGLWIRHRSAGGNANRGRANAVASALLCSDFLTRDIAVSGDVDLSDPAQVAAAVRANPECIGCHQALDPLAAFWYGWFTAPLSSGIIGSHDSGCGDVAQPDIDDRIAQALCYPLDLWWSDVTFYSGGAEITYDLLDDYWLGALDLREPLYYGLGDDPQKLGEYIAEDPRFATCAVERFYSFLTQTEPSEVPAQTRAELLTAFSESGSDARELARAVVTSDPVISTTPLPGDDRERVGLSMVRPGQYARMIEDLTGFTWAVNADDFGCESDGCRCRDGLCPGDVDLAKTDAFGFRAMAGGMDGFKVLGSHHDPTPTRLMVYDRYAAEAAAHVVGSDLGGGAPRLLTMVSATDTDEATVRAQLTELHLRIHGLFEADAAAEIDASWALFSAALADTGGASGAWEVVLTAMLQHPRALFY